MSISDLPLDRLREALEGRYRIGRELGEGGMATVYLADDLRHERQVALKVLKPELAAVVGADRFLAEIRTTAKLQHPHILPLFDSGEADGLLFYVMPYVEGESLANRLHRERQLPVDEAVQIARNVAEALDYAHRQGVIHRDIKPANILLQDGKPVISDFGIALAVGAAGGGRLTETGMSLGTPHYMSPEQATGDQSVGAATDIYALGCVLYEILVGEPPFTGSTPQAVLGRIITGKTPSATAERALVPPHVDAAILRALEKIPADRFSRAADLDQALGDPTFRHGEKASAQTSTRGSWLVVGLAVLWLALAVVWLWNWTRGEAPGPPERLVIPFEPGMEPRGGGGQWAIFPDGTALVYRTGSSEALQLRRLVDGHSTSVPGSEGGAALALDAISPDGNEVAIRVEGEIRVLPLSGGPSRTLMPGRVASWGDDGYLYVSTDEGLDRIPAEGGQPERVTRLAQGEVLHHFTDAVPGGILIDVNRGDRSSLEFVDMRSLERTLLVPEGQTGRWLETGHLVYRVDETLTADAFDVGARRVADRPISLQTGVGDFFISLEGRLFYREVERPGSLELVWMSRSGEAEPVSGQRFEVPLPAAGWSLSPDDNVVAFSRSVEANVDIWVMETSSGELRRLTDHPAQDFAPRWSPDGSEIGFGSTRADSVAGPYAFWTVPRDGGQTPRLLFGQQAVSEGAWSPDGRWLVVRTTTGPTGSNVTARDILGIRPGVDSLPRPVAASPEEEETEPQVSPDGRWLAYTSSGTGGLEVFVQPFPDADGTRWQVSLDGGRMPLWAHRSSELFFVRPDSRELIAVRYDDSSSDFRIVSREPLFVVPPEFHLFNYSTYDLSSDDRYFLMARTPADAPSDPAERIFVIDHWAQEVERRSAR